MEDDSSTPASATTAGRDLTPSGAPAPTGTPTGSSAANASLSKRRRGLGVVTPNACTECRKKRAKCDGLKPCTRCKAQDTECVYEVPVRQSKEDLRSEIEQLRQKQRSNEQVLAALVHPELTDEVLAGLRSGQTVESISEWLGETQPPTGSGLPPHPVAGSHSTSKHTGTLGSPSSASLTTGNPARPLASASAAPQSDSQPPLYGSPWHFSSQDPPERRESQPDMMNWTPDTNAPPHTRVGSWAEPISDRSSEGGQRYRGLEHVLAPLYNPDVNTPHRSWTSITSDTKLVQHLLALYFCWEYPTFASLSKEHFLKDFQGGTPRYCSPILVNALLALGCRFSTKPSTRAYADDPYSAGDHFFQESLRLFYLEGDHHTLTTIQALGIMSIREASCGRDSESWYYSGQSIRLAMEMGLHHIDENGDDDEIAVQAATFWGAFALDHAWSLATGSLPQCSTSPRLPPKPEIIQDIEASLWMPYTDDGTPLQRSCEQYSNVRSVYTCFCELSELVHQSLYILHSPARPLTSRRLLDIYTKYLNWYDSVPEVLRLGHNFTPAVLFAHMYYHFAILLLFRPLIKLRIVGSKVLPRDVCCQAADAIQGLLRSYSRLYTLRRTPSFVPYFVLTSSIMHLAIGATTSKAQQLARSSHSPARDPAEAASRIDPRVADAIKQGIADLTEMAPCHHFAEQALHILQYLAKKWNMDVDLEEKRPGAEGHGRNNRPYASSLNFFVPNMREEDFICSWGRMTNIATSGIGEQASVAGMVAERAPQEAQSTENPLFWPFPMQGRPVLPGGDELHEAGFALLAE